MSQVAVRRGGLKLLALLVGVVPNIFEHLPPATSQQLAAALRGVANLEPDRDLRQLAAKLEHALTQARALPS